MGKVRHIEVNQLWLQDKVFSGEVEIQKVKGESNIADALTQHINNKLLEWHRDEVGYEIVVSRHKLMPEVG